MKCPNCSHENASGANYCTNCNTALIAVSSSATPSPASPSTPPTPSPTPTTPPAQSSASTYSTAAPRSASPYSYQPYYSYPAYSPKEKAPFTITDVYIIIGFVLAILGVFTYSFILLPASIFFSVVGFVKRTNRRTLGLSIAGIVVGVVACIIRVGTILSELGIIPDWLSAGIFG